MNYFSIVMVIFLYPFTLTAHDYRILVLGCGGGTSIINTVQLAHIEKYTGKPIAALFDEIWGASAGSIIGALLSSPTSRCKSAAAITRLFETIFRNYHTAYYIREMVAPLIGKHTLIKDTTLPLRILTATQQPFATTFTPYDFSSDGSGSCSYTHIPLVDIVAASCTVYPYLFRTPVTITIDPQHTRACIDPGSLGCEPSIIEPTAYFLEALLPRLTPHNTVTIYFLGNAFTQSIDYQAIDELLTRNSSHHSWAIRDKEGTFNPHERTQIEIVNIPFTTPCSDIINNYLAQANFAQRVHIKIIKAIFDRIVGKDNCAANMLAAGIVPITFLKKEADTVIESSTHFKTMMQILIEN